MNVFRVYLDPGASMPDVRPHLAVMPACSVQVFVLTNQELRAYILRVTDQWFSLTSVQIAVAVVVAILGIVNTLTVSITDRRRELGVLRAVGGLRGQIRRTVWMEALSIGALGLVLGWLLGAVNLYYILQVVQHDVAGMRLSAVVPAPIALALIPMMMAAAFVAALWPAERRGEGIAGGGAGGMSETLSTAEGRRVGWAHADVDDRRAQFRADHGAGQP